MRAGPRDSREVHLQQRRSRRAGSIGSCRSPSHYTATTLDGFIADEHNSLQWLFDVAGDESPESGDSGWQEFFDGVGVLAMGSTTWEWIVDHEDLLHHPERWGKAYAERPCWVFSSQRAHRRARP